MKKIFTTFFVLFLGISFAQNPTRIFKKLLKNKENLEIQVSDGTYYISFVNENIAETSFVPLKEKLNQISHAKIAQNIPFNYKKISDKSNLIVLETKMFSIKVFPYLIGINTFPPQ